MAQSALTVIAVARAQSRLSTVQQVIEVFNAAIDAASKAGRETICVNTDVLHPLIPHWVHAHSAMRALSASHQFVIVLRMLEDEGYRVYRSSELFGGVNSVNLYVSWEG